MKNGNYCNATYYRNSSFSVILILFLPMNTYFTICSSIISLLQLFITQVLSMYAHDSSDPTFPNVNYKLPSVCATDLFQTCSPEILRHEYQNSAHAYFV